MQEKNPNPSSSNDVQEDEVRIVNPTDEDVRNAELSSENELRQFSEAIEDLDKAGEDTEGGDKNNS